MGGLYGFVLCVVTVLQDLYTTHVEHTTYGSGVGSLVFAGVFLLYIGLFSGGVGLIGGAVLGAALVPLVRSWTRSTPSLAATSAAFAFILGALAFPWVPLGGSASASDVGEILTLKVVPALMSACAAAWHVCALRRGR